MRPSLPGIPNLDADDADAANQSGLVAVKSAKISRAQWRVPIGRGVIRVLSFVKFGIPASLQRCLTTAGDAYIILSGHSCSPQMDSIRPKDSDDIHNVTDKLVAASANLSIQITPILHPV